jgi:hypothetical protein
MEFLKPCLYANISFCEYYWIVPSLGGSGQVNFFFKD